MKPSKRCVRDANGCQVQSSDDDDDDDDDTKPTRWIGACTVSTSHFQIRDRHLCASLHLSTGDTGMVNFNVKHYLRP